MMNKNLCQSCKIGPADPHHECKREEGDLQIKCEKCGIWSDFVTYFAHPCKKLVHQELVQKETKPMGQELCPDCFKPILHTLQIHREVWHRKGQDMTRPITECDLCGIATVDFRTHYRTFHAGDAGLKASPGLNPKLLTCPFTESCKSVSTIGMEYHLKVGHKIEDCKCGVAMTSPQFHICGVEVRSYCYICRAWVHGCDRDRYSDHIETHMSKTHSGFKECSVCHAYFPSYDQHAYKTHSCGELRRSKKGHGSMMCGRCFESFNKIDDLSKHWNDVHWSLPPRDGSKNPLTQKEIDFEKARTDMTKFPCNICREVFHDGYAYSEHICSPNGEVMKKQQNTLKVVSDVASVLAKIGRPDPGGGIVLINCATCGNRFESKERFDGHACKMKGHEKKRIALLVSPDRKDMSHMNLAVTTYGGEVIIYTRGIPSEEHLEKTFRAAGATVLKIAHDVPARRDAMMIQQADLCLMFPSAASQKSNQIMETNVTAQGAKIPAIVYPDCIYIEPVQVPEVPAKAEEKPAESAKAN